MTLGFNPVFEKPILDKIKKHTFRDDPKRRWKAGKKIHFAIGVRTKNYRQFYEGECKETQETVMTLTKDTIEELIVVEIDGRTLTHEETVILAINDGFNSYNDFHDWFYPLIKKSDNQAYKPNLIHWTDLKY